MGSSRIWRTLLFQTMLFGCGAAAAGAWAGALYASFLVAMLIGLWLATLAMWRSLPLREWSAPLSPGSDSQLPMLRALIEQTPSPLLSIEGDGRIRLLNRAARRAFTQDDVLSAPPTELISGSHLRLGSHNYRIDRAELRAAGDSRTVVALVDIEGEVRAAEARTTRELLDVLSHEIMNALTPVASLSESALDMMSTPTLPVDALREMLGTLSRRTAALQRFTLSYRSLARLPEPTIADTEIVPMCDDLSLLFRTRWNERIIFKCETGVPTKPARFDREQIEQALWALLQNAAEAAIAGERIARVELEARQSAADISFLITDSGIGIATELPETLFRAFYTTKINGSGVGLSLARQIAREHGGDVRALPAPAKIGGAAFELCVPI